MRRFVPAASASNAVATRGKLLSHAPTLQNMDDPNIDWGDPLVIEVWAQMWKDLPLSGGLIGNGDNLSDNSGSVDSVGDSLGGSSETREQCIARHRRSCDLQFYACLSVLVSGGIVFFGTCTLTTFILGLPACAFLTGVIGVVGGGACVLNGIACLNNAQDGCPQ